MQQAIFGFPEVASASKIVLAIFGVVIVHSKRVCLELCCWYINSTSQKIWETILDALTISGNPITEDDMQQSNIGFECFFSDSKYEGTLINK